MPKMPEMPGAPPSSRALALVAHSALELPDGIEGQDISQRPSGQPGALTPLPTHDGNQLAGD